MLFGDIFTSGRMPLTVTLREVFKRGKSVGDSFSENVRVYGSDVMRAQEAASRAKISDLHARHDPRKTYFITLLLWNPQTFR
jgi:hypothetical protein